MGKKYLFDQHNFDTPSSKKEEEVIPHITLPEADYEQALKDAYNRGRAEGEQAAAAKTQELLERDILHHMGDLVKQAQALFSQEEKRSKLFEIEAVVAAYASFNTLLPGIKDKFLQNEVQSFLQQNLQQTDFLAGRLEIYLPDNLLDRMTDYLDQKKSELGADVRMDIKSSGEAGSVQIKWNDGGTVFYFEEVAKQIETAFIHLLELQAPEKLKKPQDVQKIEEEDKTPPGDENALEPEGDSA